MRLARLLLPLSLVLAAVVFPGVAFAIPMHQDPNANILIKTFVLKDTVDASTADLNDINSWLEITNDDTVEPYYFNAGRCTCDTPVRIVLRKNKLANTTTGTTFLYAGSRCNDTSGGDWDKRCNLLGSFQTNKFQSDTDQPIIVKSSQLMFPSNLNGVRGRCISAQDQTVSLFALTQTGSTDTFETTSSRDYGLDTAPPPQVSDYAVDGTEDGVAVSWTIGVVSPGDIYYFQAFCSRQDGTPLRSTPLDDSKLLFADTCGPLAGGPTSGADAGVPDAGGTAADAEPEGGRSARGESSTAAFVPADSDAGPADDLSKDYLCGSTGATSNSLGISLPDDVVLAKGEKINVRLLVIDRFGNFVDMGAKSASPAPAYDFWETFNDKGGEVEPGFCFVATAAYGDYDHPFVLVLRDFRDHTLAKFGAGRSFIAWYYRNSPPLAAFIREHEVARVAAQVVLWPLVILAGTWEYTSALDKLALLAVFTFVIGWRRRRKAARRLAAAEPPTEPTVPIETEARKGRRRVRALAAGAATLLVVLCTSHIAFAQAVYDDAVESYDEAPKRSQWAAEVKVGPYYPDVDESDGLTASPYRLMFRDRMVAMTQFELDRFFLYPGGQLGLAAGIGYFQRSTHSFATHDDGTPNYDMRAPADNTAFHLIPLTLSAVYRFTSLADNTVVPLVPYAKLGLEYGLWWITKTNGVAHLQGGDDAEGGTLGYQATLGLSVRVDAFDPGAARNMQIEMGVEHVGFFAELNYAAVDGLGEAHKMHVGDATWSAGINFEF